MKHLERRKRERANIRQAILDAALDIAIAEGWQAVTIRKIAEEVEYTTSIVYSHFKNKEELLVELSDYGFQKMRNLLHQVLEQEMEPRLQLLQLCSIHWDFALRHKELYDLMFNGDHIIHGNTLRRPVSSQAVGGINTIKNIFSGITGKTDVESLILNWVCLRRGTIELLTQITPPEFDLDPEATYMEFMERFIDSIAAKGSK